MKREVKLSDLKQRYGADDMVRADCGGCKGCSQCCHFMGTSVGVDPYDANRISRGLGKPFALLLKEAFELHAEDGLILPNLRMDPETKGCVFLDAQQRCSIHALRPGVCRMFPLGRVYEENSFQYYLQKEECPRPGKNKVRVRKWLDQPQLVQYETYVLAWNQMKNEIRAALQKTEDDALKTQVCQFALQLFYGAPALEDEMFYADQAARREKMKKLLFTIEW